jgi:SAM-dependent methyltransferase
LGGGDFKELLEIGRLAIFLDGLDLLGGSEDFVPTVEIQNFMSEFSRCKFVLSSRPGFFEGFKSNCKVSELVELDDHKIKGYIHKYLGDGDGANKLISRIFDHQNKRLKSLCRNPMMLYLVIWLQKDGRMVDGRAGIYRESVEGIITHYKEKGKALPSNEQHVKDVLKELAFSMQKENTVRLDYGGAMDVAGSCTSPKRYMGVNAEQLLKDCFSIGLLHKDGSEIRFGFHQSFQEYFTAVKLKEIFELGYDISESFSHPKWEDALVVLSEITERPDGLFDNVMGAGEILLAAKLTAHVDDHRVELLCALLLDNVDSESDSEKYWSVESFAYVGGRAVGALRWLLACEDYRIVLQTVETLGKIGDERSVEPLTNILCDDDHEIRWRAAQALGRIGGERVVGALINALNDDDRTVQLIAIRALDKIGDERSVEPLTNILRDEPMLRESFTICGSNAEQLFIKSGFSDCLLEAVCNFSNMIYPEKIFKELKKKPTPTKAKSRYTTPSVAKDAEELRTDSHLGALIDRLKLVPDGTTVVDYGCGKGALLGRMNEIEKELGKIHYIGVDISRGNRYLAGITAKRCGIADKLKSCDFMEPDEFFSKNIDIDNVFFSHVLHEIRLKDLPDILYHLLSKMKAGSRITILEQRILVEPERDFVTWNADDFDMLFSGFTESSPRPYQTVRGHELISVDLERRDTDVSLESMRKRCLEVYERKKEWVSEAHGSSDLSEKERQYLSELYTNIGKQIAEYQKSIGLDD